MTKNIQISFSNSINPKGIYKVCQLLIKIIHDHKYYNMYLHNLGLYCTDYSVSDKKEA